MKAVARANSKNLLSDMDDNKYELKVVKSLNLQLIIIIILTFIAITRTLITSGNNASIIKDIKATELRQIFNDYNWSQLICINLLNKEASENTIWWKTAHLDIELKLMKILCSLSINGIQINEVDIARDYGGSLCLNEVVLYFKKYCNYKKDILYGG